MAIGDEAGLKAASQLDQTVEKLMRFLTCLKNGNKVVIVNTTTITVEPKLEEIQAKEEK